MVALLVHESPWVLSWNLCLLMSPWSLPRFLGGWGSPSMLHDQCYPLTLCSVLWTSRRAQAIMVPWGVVLLYQPLLKHLSPLVHCEYLFFSQSVVSLGTSIPSAPNPYRLTLYFSRCFLSGAPAEATLLGCIVECLSYSCSHLTWTYHLFKGLLLLRAHSE